MTTIDGVRVRAPKGKWFRKIAKNGRVFKWHRADHTYVWVSGRSRWWCTCGVASYSRTGAVEWVDIPPEGEWCKGR